MRKGFTLVELSIVLVIIGLLIGGILVAQSLIETAKLGSLIRQFQQYDAGVASFQSRYRGMPGDSGLAFTRATTATVGQTALKEGLLTDENTQNNSLRYEVAGSAEYLLFWLDLARISSLTPDNCPQLATRADPFSGGRGIRMDGDDCNVAKSEYGEADGTIVAAAYDINSSSTSSAAYIGPSDAPYNSYFIGDCALDVSPFFVCEPTLSHTQALSLDSKIDDGIPNAGDITSFTNTGWETFRINDKALVTSYDPSSSNLVSATVKLNVY